MQNVRFFILLLWCFSLGLSAHAQVDVWPGDVNNNGEVNHYDLLYFGLGYSYQGPPRLQKSVLFQAQNTLAWQQSLPNQTNFAFLDCNGNGHISPDDTIAIRLNYSQRHGNLTSDLLSPVSSNGDSLFMALAADSVLNKSKIEIPIHLGTPNVTIDSFYGLAFSLAYDPQRFKPGSFSVKLDSSSWINAGGGLSDQPLLMYFERSADGKLDIAVSKSNLVNASGNGRFLIISCVIEDNLIGKGYQALELQLEDVLLIGNNLDRKAIKTSSKSLNIIPTSIDKVPVKSIDINAYPNPASDYITVQVPENSKEFELSIFDLGGKQYNVNVTKNNIGYKIELHNLPAAYYILRLKNEDYELYKKFVKF